jgi:inorganic triphosphatase YgiF
MPVPTEIELKLTCDDPSAFVDHPLLADVQPSSSDELKSVYFDTPDRRLHKAGLVLRVRSSGNGLYIQTLKGEGDGLVERPEWEMLVKSAKPNIKALAKTPAAKALGDKPELSELFQIHVERTTYLIRQGQSEIEVALDRGRINAAGDVHPIGEIELELKAGSAEDLFSVARTFSAHANLPLGVRSKAERGFALLRSEAAEAGKPDLVPLHDGMTAAGAFIAIAHACIRHMRVNEDMLLDHRNPEVLHQIRVAVRRLRSAMSLFADLMVDDQTPRIREELKRLSEPLGVARNLDVFLSETLPRERLKRPDEIGLLNLEKQLEVRRTEAYAKVLETLHSQQWRAFILELLTWVNAGAWLHPAEKKAAMRLSQPAKSFAVSELEKRRRQVKKRGRRLKEKSDEERHHLRIAAKKLRYGSEFFARLFERKKEAKRHASFVGALKNLQDQLGALNDISTGRELVGGLKGHSAVFAAGLTTGDLEAATGPLLMNASIARKALIGMRPFWR